MRMFGPLERFSQAHRFFVKKVKNIGGNTRVSNSWAPVELPMSKAPMLRMMARKTAVRVSHGE